MAILIGGVEMNVKISVIVCICLYSFATGCSTQQLVSESFLAARNFGRQNNERNNFLALSTSTFYPDGVPNSVETLPTLNAEQLALIEIDAQRQVNLLLPVLERHINLIALVFKRTSDVLKDQQVSVMNADTNTIQMSPTGTIKIDVKVIQSIYRGVLVETMSRTVDEISDDPDKIMSAENQKNALRRLFLIRERYLALTPIPTIGTVKNALDAWRETHGTWEQVAESTFTKSLGDVESALLTKETSDLYDDAMAFIISHELAHRSLRHYARLENGESAMELELEADRFGAMLVVLARNRNVKPNIGYPVAPPWAEGTHSGMFQNGVCVTDINYKPKGHTSFFKFGYQLAGFDTITEKGKTHPEKSVRLQASEEVSTATYKGIDDAQDHTGSCYMYKKEFLNLVNTNPSQVVKNKLMRTADDLKEANENAKTQSEYVDMIKIYTEALYEPLIYEAVYLRYLSLLQKDK